MTRSGRSSQKTSGSIVGWGSQVFGVDLSRDFVAVAAGWAHSLGLKADGSIVAWGDNLWGQCTCAQQRLRRSGGRRNTQSGPEG
jgi:alpha-tubulin suppressor-like RCC1 family protein